MLLSIHYFYLSLVNNFIPYIYLLLILVLIIPFSILVSFQLFQLIQFELSLRYLKTIDCSDYSMDQLFKLLKILVKKKLWLTSINLMESRKNISDQNKHQYFNAIGYLYYNMNKYNLACLYYIKALSSREDYIVALQNLANVYEKKKNYLLVLSTYKRILKYDKYNVIANQYIEKRNL